MANPSFSFMLNNIPREDVQTRVTVYSGQITNDQIIYDTTEAQFRPNKNETRDIMEKLTTDLLLSRRGTTLVRIGPHLRIDSQKISRGLIDSGIWQNIHIQNGLRGEQMSFSVVKIGQGCQLCYQVGYHKMLLKYLKGGLFDSWGNNMKYVIPVRIETRRKENRDTNWIGTSHTEEEIIGLSKEIEKRTKSRQKFRSERIPEYKSNLSKITQSTTMIEQVVAVVEKNLDRILEKEGAHTVEAKIAVVSIVVGIFCQAVKLKKGYISDVIAVIATDVLAEIPGLSTASAARFVALVAMDLADVVKKNKHRKLTDDEIEDLQMEITKIKAEMKEFSMESPIFGKGTYDESYDEFYDEFYDESEITHIDDISKIHITSSDFIDGIQIEYKLGWKGAYHGGQGGTLKTMVLDQNEKITTVEISTCQGAVGSLTFCTDFGRRVKFGEVHVHGDVKTNIYELADGYYLAAIKGYDMFKNENGEATKTCPTLPGNREVLPAIGFIATF